MGWKASLPVSGSTGKLNSEALSHEIRSVKSRNNVAGIHRILVFDEAETVHQLHLGDFPGAMSRKVCLDIGLGSIARKVAQVEPGGRDLSHDDGQAVSLARLRRILGALREEGQRINAASGG